MAASKQSLSIQLELVWWLITLVITAGILFPIWNQVPTYDFYPANIIFIVVFVTATRYIFLLRHTFLGTRQILKAILMMLLIPLIFYLVQEVNYFQTFLDERGAEAVVGNLGFGKTERMIKYVRSQIIFFGVGAVISCVLLFFRLVISIWRYHNRGTV